MVSSLGPSRTYRRSFRLNRRRTDFLASAHRPLDLSHMGALMFGQLGGIRQPRSFVRWPYEVTGAVPATRWASSWRARGGSTRSDGGRSDAASLDGPRYFRNHLHSQKEM